MAFSLLKVESHLYIIYCFNLKNLLRQYFKRGVFIKNWDPWTLSTKIFINDWRTVLKIFAVMSQLESSMQFSALCRAVQRRDQSVHKNFPTFIFNEFLQQVCFNMIQQFMLQPHEFGDNKETNVWSVRNNIVVKYGYWNSSSNKCFGNFLPTMQLRVEVFRIKLKRIGKV